ncbi:MAG: hypothetical protein H0U79_07360, partial [Solirubrobacterales bacterium]|nr:hypothetical protein [Solirubrobacterales bacterium]
MTLARHHALLVGLSVLAAVLFATATLRPSSAVAQDVGVQRVASAKAFADSVGINVHLNYLDSTYGDFGSLAPKLETLGVRWVRDGFCDTCRV